MTVIDDAAAAKILKSGYIEPGDRLHELAHDLDAIARAVLTERHLTKGSRGRPITKLGPQARKLLFGELAGFWIDAPGIAKLPGATWRGEHQGAFIEFAIAYCGALADYLDAEAIAGRAIGWRSVAVDLRSIQQSGSKAREGLRLLGLGRMKNGQRFSKKPHPQY